jgi:hypothetical protein
MYDTPLHSPYSKGSGGAAHAALPIQSKLTNHFGIFAEHIEVVNFDFCDIFFISIFVGIVAVDEFAFDHNLFAFVQIFFSFFGRPTPSNEAVPGGVFDNLTIVVIVNFIGDEGESGHFPTPFKCFDFWHAAKITDQTDLISKCVHNTIKFKGK